MTSFSRRSFLASALASTSMIALPARGSEALPFHHNTVISKAYALAATDYSPRPSVPQDWLDMSYQDYQTRWFRNRDALWSDGDSSYNVDFFLPGLYFPRPVQVNTVSNSHGAQRVPFDLSLFDKTDKAPDLSIDDSLGYSGLRLRTELSQPNLKNEFCVYQGASYFRAIGMDNVYGLSARGLALKTGDPMGEEFPEFVEFWLETPAAGQRNIVVHALMDSPSVTGAYRFDITPGDNCTMEVQATLFPREELSHVGLGPLTSMFLFDDTNRTRFDDFRPAVHDSDGLLVQNGHGEALWRPLANPLHLQISSFVDENPRGFGLMQRARRFSDFADLEANYHKRPCLWVEPDGDWGKGAVTLVEIPADQEIYDNIVAYWRPRKPYAAGEQINLSYRLTWGHEPDLHLPKVINTAGGARVFGGPGRIMTLDFEDHPLLSNGPDGIDVHISSPHVDTSAGVLQRNPETGGLRLAFSFDPAERDLVELRAQLRKDGQMASEVWLYRWTA
ncbi:glucan biosynthesis protein G [Sedimentitalea sp. CY04]|uniref:Glucan biosynthesis protein G n=1 Tax=Parasedimentitalea denitrificans TaxID=2211118 RepID=A0ABX0W6N0_9RHOB|nr:glucan biosynthesis protein G [Sedimentitalea sp. CY04]NIZ59940.1 glucan biosynthesis protein G [Sedimentitalea sp. CY04]